MKALLILALLPTLAQAAQPEDGCLLFADVAAQVTDLRDGGITTRADFQTLSIDLIPVGKYKTMAESMADFVWDHPENGKMVTMPWAYAACLEAYK
jgi:hypothetical protein